MLTFHCQTSQVKSHSQKPRRPEKEKMPSSFFSTATKTIIFIHFQSEFLSKKNSQKIRKHCFSRLSNFDQELSLQYILKTLSFFSNLGEPNFISYIIYIMAVQIAFAIRDFDYSQIHFNIKKIVIHGFPFYYPRIFI